MLGSCFCCISPEERRTVLLVCGVASAVLVTGVLGVLLVHHLSPCNPAHIGRCGRRLASTLQGLDSGRLTPQEETSALCPTLVEAVDCFYWFSQRCLPASDQHFHAKVYVDISALVDGLCRSPPFLVTHGPCLRHAREARWQCGERFLGTLRSPDGDGAGATDSLVDSLYDPGGVGTFQTPLCRAVREFILCSLRLVRDHCGLPVALGLQELNNNLTSLVFSSKCDPDLRPVLPGIVPMLPKVKLSLSASLQGILILIASLVLLATTAVTRKFLWPQR